jgi:hypothetical protein
MFPQLAHSVPTVLLLLVSASLHAEQYRIDCPLSIQADAVQLAKPPGNWTSAVQGPFWLHSAGPMDGPPSDTAVLKEGASTKRRGKKTVTKWDMSAFFAAGKWMACNYGYGNDLILSTRLDDKTSECIVTSVELASGKVEIDIRCKR